MGHTKRDMHLLQAVHPGQEYHYIGLRLEAAPEGKQAAFTSLLNQSSHSDVWYESIMCVTAGYTASAN